MRKRASAERVAFNFLALKKKNVWEHPLFGGLKWDPSLRRWRGAVKVGPIGKVRFFLEGKEKKPEEFDTQKAEKIYNKFLSGERKLKMMAALENIDLYNSEWKEETGPGLSPKELADRWALTDLIVREGGSGSLWYDVGGAFTDHGIEIRFGPGGRYGGSYIS